MALPSEPAPLQQEIERDLSRPRELTNIEINIAREILKMSGHLRLEDPPLKSA
jgi:hypothetical protein